MKSLMLFGTALLITSLAAVTSCAKLPKSSLMQARELCREKKLKGGTEAYAACILFEESRITQEILKEKQKRTK